MSNTCRESINNNEAQDGRRDKMGKTAAAELRALGGEAEYGRAGVQQDDNVRSLIDATVDRFGRIDIAVNSAGVEGAPGSPQAQSSEHYADAFETNLLGTMLGVRRELGVMTGKGSGSIINLSSAFGHRVPLGLSSKAPSKQGIGSLTKTTVVEAAGCGVPVNAAAPGAVKMPLLERLMAEPAPWPLSSPAFRSSAPAPPKRSSRQSCFLFDQGRSH